MIKTKKTRVNWTISKKYFDLLKRASQIQGCSISKLVESMIQKTLYDPVHYLTEQKRDLAKQMLAIDDQIAHLEELQNEIQITNTKLGVAANE